ncbi:DNA helicase IV [Apilactobacillus kunkeei]|uniref:RNA polymerase recycling motor HelD n=1 Tax=Apilactobacillus kunkeei TaxID=148814 RepID=UPI00200A4BDA|nr:RNA polymerase recycling motor HelD [Apilactobacillus kunkeei]MCK8628474.1 AAA family ATPase [Apilactobacillus kunkeei]CAI2637676.1 DNA helicase IV [Apilactobacillus kunkeei]CAI2640420.1 DNA helicase IV [Apilactobacillus kunkeei]CAI2640774.1 DNA helicase IV [Apilactobacillus kunkeei]CAI2690511.1 DNA helicase IV [Apilactobacillus kunkeei]
MSESIKEQEQKHLNDVLAKVEIAKAEAVKKINRAEKDEHDINKNFYNDVRLKTSTYSGMMETSVSIRQQQQMLEERENSWKHATKEYDKLAKMQERPYFARLDFEEEGEHKAETIYIGLGSFADSPDHYLIYDWRAPISSIYYDSKIGKLTYHTPMGEQTVNVTLKRQFQIKDGKIETIFDTDQVVGDQMLLDNLNGKSNTKMKSIVTTIQREQNKIIRDTKSDLLFVQGAAGSGKTAAVLQRVAFLLYQYRGKLSSAQVVLFSPNQLFNDYINQVLPELGEQNMVQMTYYQYSSLRVPKFKVETLSERFEEDNSEDKKLRNINNLKNSLEFFKAETAYTNHLNSEDMKFKNLKFQDDIFISKEQIAEIYYSFNENYNLRNRLDATKERLIKILNRRVKVEMKKPWVEQAVQDLSREQIQAVQNAHPDEFENADKEFDFLARHIVIGAFKRIRKQIVHGRFLGVNNQLVHFLRNVPNLIDLSKYDLTKEDWTKSVDASINQMKNGHISMSDVSVYLYLFDRISGKRPKTDIKYLFIDEVQDYTAFQMAFMKFTFPRARFTLLGDLNQAIFTHENSHTLLSELSTMFDPEKTNVVQLTKSYRSTEQITDFTKHILEGGSQIESFARVGDKPVMQVVENRDAALDKLVARIDNDKEKHDTTAIIVKTLADAKLLSEQLDDRNVKNTLIQTENQRLTTGTLVIPAYLAKGLEFDSVVMFDADDKHFGDEADRQLVYTICTRAMHELTIIAEGKPTHLFDVVPSDLYDLQ